MLSPTNKASTGYVVYCSLWKSEAQRKKGGEKLGEGFFVHLRAGSYVGELSENGIKKSCQEI